jgi:hypothetical protein
MQQHEHYRNTISHDVRYASKASKRIVDDRRGALGSSSPEAAFSKLTGVSRQPPVRFSLPTQSRGG